MSKLVHVEQQQPTVQANETKETKVPKKPDFPPPKPPRGLADELEAMATLNKGSIEACKTGDVNNDSSDTQKAVFRFDPRNQTKDQYLKNLKQLGVVFQPGDVLIAEIHCDGYTSTTTWIYNAGNWNYTN